MTNWSNEDLKKLSELTDEYEEFINKQNNHFTEKEVSLQNKILKDIFILLDNNEKTNFHQSKGEYNDEG